MAQSSYWGTLTLLKRYSAVVLGSVSFFLFGGCNHFFDRYFSCLPSPLMACVSGIQSWVVVRVIFLQRIIEMLHSTPVMSHHISISATHAVTTLA